MIIGLPKEIKSNENRVGLVPAGVETLCTQGHTVIVETNAGFDSGFNDDAYRAAGAKIVKKAKDVYAQSDMIVKVKEPIKQEYPFIRSGQIVFTYFHFAANEELTHAMMKSHAVCIAYETVQSEDRSLPLLIPMSEVAGRMAPQEGAKYLVRTQGGRGILLGGVPGVEPAHVVILGGGIVGTNAAKIAAGLGARVSILDSNIFRLRQLDDIMPKNVVMIASNLHTIQKEVKTADIVIGSVLIPGAKAPKLITKAMLKMMKQGLLHDLLTRGVDENGDLRPTPADAPKKIFSLPRLACSSCSVTRASS